MKLQSMLIILSMMIGVIILVSMQNDRVVSKKMNTELENRIDTFDSKDYVQIVKWNNGVISNIRVQQKLPSRKEGIYVMSQDIDFDNRGILDSLYMFHGRKMVQVEGGYEGHYQSNYVYFDTLGNILDFRFMKDFHFEYQMKK